MRNAKIDFRYSFSSNHVGARAATNDSHVERGASLGIVQMRNGENLMRQFEDCALSFVEVESEVQPGL